MALTLGRLDEAIAVFRQALARDPLSAGGYHKLGVALDSSDRLAEAEVGVSESTGTRPPASSLARLSGVEPARAGPRRRGVGRSSARAA
jgi:hypothetical protein